MAKKATIQVKNLAIPMIVETGDPETPFGIKMMKCTEDYHTAQPTKVNQQTDRGIEIVCTPPTRK